MEFNWEAGQKTKIFRLTDILLQVVSVEVEDQIVDKVVSVADNDQRQLVRQFGLLQEVLHPGREEQQNVLHNWSVTYQTRHKKWENILHDLRKMLKM